MAGSSDDCFDQLAGIASDLPVGPMIFRPHWPGMASEEVVSYLDQLGSELVPALRSLESDR